MSVERKSLLDELVSGFGNVVTDIREKAVEEAWFGKTVTEPEPEPRLWQERVAEVAPREPEREREPDRDMER